MRATGWMLAVMIGATGCVVAEPEAGPGEMLDAAPAAPDMRDTSAADAGPAEADLAPPPPDQAPPDAAPAPDPEPEPVPEPDPQAGPPPPAPWLAEPYESEARPLDVLCLDARDLLPVAAIERQPWRFHWRVSTRPLGSVARWVERYTNPGAPAGGGEPDDPSTPQACIFMDLAGEWALALDVDGGGQRLHGATVRVHVIPGEDIHVQLVWDTPADGDQTDDDGTDVDLHLRHPRGRAWDEAPLDCYFANQSPDWGHAGPPANPSLDIDDVNGAGPENINLDHPEDTAALGAGYRVGVDYYRSESFLDGDYGPSRVTVRVFLQGALAAEFERVLAATGDFWDVAAIHWEDGVGRVEPIDQLLPGGQAP